MPSWDPSISLGNIITLVGFVVSIVTLHVNNVRRFERLNAKFDMVFDWWQKRIVGDRNHERD